jgi:uncharacterized protein (DUF2141 family)
LANSRPRVLLLAGAALASTAASQPPTAELDVSISGLRNHKGAVMLCLTRRAGPQFLECGRDPARVTRVVASGTTGGDEGAIRIAGLVAGEYSLLVIHDENRNGRLDTMLGVPREGFGFSRNPAIRLGPPRYGDVHFALFGRMRQAVTLKYLL